MREGKRPATRVVAAFVAGALAAGLFALSMTPVGAHVKKAGGTPVGLKHLIKHLQDEFVSQDDFVTWGRIAMNVGDPDVVIHTWGPFTLIARCRIGDNGEAVQARVIITTSEDNSSFWSSSHGSEDDFDPTDNNNPVLWADAFADFPTGGAQEILDFGGHSRAESPSGTSLFGVTNIVTNFAGAHCVFSGSVTRLAG